MSSVTVNYEALDKEQYLAAAHKLTLQSQRRWPRLVMLLVVLAPMLGWYGWHQQWVALAVIIFWSGWFWRKKTQVDPKKIRRVFEHPQETFSLRPEGMLTTWNDGGYRWSEWSNHKPPICSAAGLSFQFVWGEEQLLLPRESFSSAREFEAYAAQAHEFHAAATSNACTTLPVLREPEAHAPYVLRFQPRDQVLVVTQVFTELQKQFPHVVPQPQPVETWRTWLIIALGAGTIYALFFDLHRGEFRAIDYTRATSLGFLLYLVYFWLLFKMYLRYQPRWVQAQLPRIDEVTLTLTEHGVHLRQADAESFTTWSDYNAVLHHAGHVTLWRGTLCLNVIPDSAFTSPAEAAACAEWILQKITPPEEPRSNDEQLPTQQPDSPPVYPPDTGNPYQAPRYS